RLEVQSAGLGLSATAAAPSPLPFAPWQDAQLPFATFSPCSMTFLSFGNGFLLDFSAGGASHGPSAVSEAPVNRIVMRPVRTVRLKFCIGTPRRRMDRTSTPESELKWLACTIGPPRLGSDDCTYDPTRRQRLFARPPLGTGAARCRWPAPRVSAAQRIVPALQCHQRERTVERLLSHIQETCLSKRIRD